MSYLDGYLASLSVIKGILDSSAMVTGSDSVTHADLIQMAAMLALEDLGGPRVPFGHGR